MNGAGQLTLVFYRLDENWKNEPWMNVAAALAQGSRFPHVELAIGSSVGDAGEMQNVLRIFSGEKAELVSRTGRNPNFSYVQIGCSKNQELKALAHARSLQGKPFNFLAMIRSVVYPRTTTGQDFFCAELVASTLQAAGLLSRDTNPGSATPQLLYDLYGKNAATTANPFLLHTHQQSIKRHEEKVGETFTVSNKLGHLHVVSDGRPHPFADTLKLSFDSLDMRKSISRAAEGGRYH